MAANARESGPRSPIPAVAASHPPGVARTRGARALRLLAAATALGAAVCGLFLNGTYEAPTATIEMLRGYDFATLVVVSAALAIGLVRRQDDDTLLWPGLLAYLVYSYFFVAVTGGLGAVFLLDVAVLSLSTFALALALSSTDAAARRVRHRAPSRVAGVVLGLLALGLGGMWLTATIVSAVTGQVPAGSVLVESELVVRLGILLDLALLVPVYAFAAVLLWRGSGWGMVLGFLAVVSGLLHQVSYLAAAVFQARADVPDARGFDTFEPVIIAVYLVALVALLLARSKARE
jgi:hypothetical protein